MPEIATMSPQQMIAHYRITAKLGEGGMGAVYRATDTKLNRDIAIKVLPPALANDAQYMARFEREAQILAALNHPNVATVHGVEQGALIMELVEGDTLADRIGHGPIPSDEALPIARQIAAGLEAAHERGIIHRDLKPANVKITPDGLVKLLDFGLAKSAADFAAAAPSGANPTISPTISLAMTQMGMILGTAAYMAPEQARGKPVDKRADIWAFGVVLYEMLTGRQLFGGGETITDTLASVVKDAPNLEALPTSAPPHMRRLLERCLRKDPSKRLRDIGEARIAIDEPESAPPATPVAVERARSWIPWALFGIAMVAGGLAYFWRETPRAGAVTLTIPPPVDAAFSGLGGPAASPDGNRIAFVATSSRVARVWIRSLDNLQARPVAGTEGASSVFWSADGNNIAFTAGGKLKRVPAEGGVAQVICDASNLRGGSWSKDGIIVFTPNVQTNLYRVSASGGDPASVTTIDASRAENSHRWPQFLPDGKRFLYYARTGNPAESGIYAGWVDPAKRSDRKLILKTGSNAMYAPPIEGARGPGYLIYLRDRTLLEQPFDADRLELAGEPAVLAEQVAESTPQAPARFFATSRLLIYGGQGGGSSQLAWFDRSGKRLAEITTGDGSYGGPSLSPDGKRIAAAFAGPHVNGADIFIVDIARSVPSRLTFGGTLTRGTIWSPDARYVAYTVLTNGRAALVKKRFDGSSSEEVISAKATASTVCDWSRDGKLILYTVPGDGTQSDLWYVSAAGEGEPRPFLQTKAQESCGQFSPDGKWVAYGSDESGAYQIFVQAFPSGGKWQVSRNGGIQPRWRGDGKELFFISYENNAVMAVDIRAGAAIESGIPSKLFDAVVAPAQSGFSYAVTADGQKFIIPTETRVSVAEPITAILNWTSLIKK
jgi:Tol biopolymer transport system component